VPIGSSSAVDPNTAVGALLGKSGPILDKDLIFEGLKDLYKKKVPCGFVSPSRCQMTATQIGYHSL
jgi:hypothetical protein